MLIILTGGTGYIGSSVLNHLVKAGHEVTALVRSDASAAAVQGNGARPLLGDITDVDWLTAAFAQADGAIHTASPGDETSEGLDRGVAAAAVAAFSGSAKPYVHTSGIWLYGNNSQITETSAFAPPALTAWRPAAEKIVTDSDLAWSIVVPSIVYGNGSGIPALLPSAPRTQAGELTTIGDGSQHWATVHVDDLAELYLLALQTPGGAGYVIGANGDSPTVRELSEAANGGGTVVAEGVDGSRARLGAYFADALLLDQQADAAKARSLGRAPTAPSLVAELRSGSYAS